MGDKAQKVGERGKIKWEMGERTIKSWRWGIAYPYKPPSPTPLNVAEKIR